MKRFFTQNILLILMSVVFLGLTACTKTAGDVANTSTADSSAPPATNNDYPPAPSALMQADIKDLDGGTFKLADKKGKVVLVNLWAIWCGPCVAEMPEFARMQSELGDKGLEVIGLNTGTQDGEEETAQNIKSFVEKRKFDYHIAYGNEDIFGEFDKKTRLGGIPQTMVINRAGQMVFIAGGGGSRNVSQIREAVEKALAE